MSGDLFNVVASRFDELVAAAAAAHGQPFDGAGLLVALSGGPDSVALLDLARRWADADGRPLLAAHFNHHLRGEFGDADEAFCRTLCADLGVPLRVGGGDVRGVARQRGRGLEEAGRTMRLQFLEAVRGEHDLAAIATGHHRDDQIETVILRMFRGTGPDGLQGIRPRRDRLIRPLLNCDRIQILDHLAAAGLSWREDASNSDGSNRRGRVRHELLPLARDIFGVGAGQAVARHAELAAEDSDLLAQLLQSAWDSVKSTTPEGLCAPAISVTALREQTPAVGQRLVRLWLLQHIPVDLALAHVREVWRWLEHGQSGSHLDLPGGVTLVRQFDTAAADGVMPEVSSVAEWRVSVEPLAEKPDPVPPPVRDEHGWRLVCSAETLQGNLRLRHPRDGDRMEPFGLGGSKKLSDLAREQRIPSSMRPYLLIVEDDGGPLWVVGVAQAERTRLLPSTRRAVTILVTPRRPERRP